MDQTELGNNAKERSEIENAISVIRKSTGWGQVIITLQNGDMTDLEVIVKKKLKKKTDK